MWQKMVEVPKHCHKALRVPRCIAVYIKCVHVIFKIINIDRLRFRKNIKHISDIFYYQTFLHESQ